MPGKTSAVNFFLKKRRGALGIISVLALFFIDRAMKVAGGVHTTAFINDRTFPFLKNADQQTSLFFFLVISVLFMAWCAATLARKRYLLAFFQLCIGAGSASNMVDWLTVRGVVDWLEVPGFAVFNLADILLLIGLGGSLALLFYEKE